MKTKSRVSERQMDIEGTTSIVSLELIPLSVSSVIAECHQENSETICSDKKSSCEENSLTPKSSKILVQESTSNERGFRPFWNQQCEELKSHFWLPSKTVLQDSDLNSSNKLLSSMVENSWFSTKLFSAPKKNSQEICSISFMCSPVECTDLEITKSKLIRIYPNKEQKKLFLSWIDVSRFTFNMTIEYLRDYDRGESKKFPSWYDCRNSIIHKLPEFCKDVPFQIKADSVKLAYKSFMEKLKTAKRKGVPSIFRFKSKKETEKSIYIPKSAIKDNGIYPRISGKLKFKEKIPDIRLDSRMIFRNGKFYMTIPTPNISHISKNQADMKIVSIDPGIRTFHTFYSRENAGFIGKGDFTRIQRLGLICDKVISKRSLSKNKQKKKSYSKAILRIQDKIKNLIDELHRKVAYFYVKNFDVILLPTFETSKMSNRNKRKIRSKTVRSMLTFSHYKFKMFLKNKCFEHGKILVDVCEAYTSKTHPETGEIRNIGGAKEIRLLNGDVIDRDLVGSRNIMLRDLVDTPERYEISFPSQLAAISNEIVKL